MPKAKPSASLTIIPTSRRKNQQRANRKISRTWNANLKRTAEDCTRGHTTKMVRSLPIGDINQRLVKLSKTTTTKAGGLKNRKEKSKPRDNNLPSILTLWTKNTISKLPAMAD